MNAEQKRERIRAHREFIEKERRRRKEIKAEERYIIARRTGKETEPIITHY